MDAPQYVHYYVPSDNMFYWMFYYTHHSDMEDPQYVHVDVPLDYMFNLMYYYTHHRDMHIPQYVSYVKKKRGNITILKTGKNIMKCELQISYTDIMWCGRKVLRLIFFLPWILFFFQIKVTTFKTVPLGS